MANDRPDVKQFANESVAYEYFLQLYNAGDFTAIRNWASANQGGNQASSRLLNLFGASCLTLGDANGAENYFRSAIKLNPKSAFARNNLGSVFFKTGQFALAEKNFTRALALDPDFEDARASLALVYLKKGQIPKAKYHFKAALRKNPNHLNTLHGYAQLFLQTKDFDQAKRYYSRVVSLAPNLISARINLAKCLIERDETGLAKEQLDSVLKQDPQNFIAHLNIGSIYQSEGNISLAKDYFDSAANLKPDSVDPLLASALASTLENDFTEAKKKLVEVLQLEPKNGRAIIVLAQCLLKLEQPYKALEALYGGDDIEMLNQSAEYHDALCMALSETGNRLESVKHGITATELEPLKIEYIFNLASSQFSLAGRETIELLYEKARRIAPNSSEVFFQWGVYHFHSKRWNEAIEVLNKAIFLDNTRAELYAVRGSCFYEDKNLRDAVNDMKLCYQIDPENKINLELIIKIASETFDWETIQKVSARVFNLNAPSPILDPMVFLHLEDAPQEQRDRAIRYTERFYPEPLRKQSIRRVPQKKIRIAYVSADFRRFAGMILMAGMLEQHDRDRFEILAISHGPKIKDEWFDRISSAVDYFYEWSELDDESFVKKARDLQLDIAVNRNGYTKDHRMNIFAQRIAPVQISYLGYPSTTGAPYMDYLVADKLLIPREFRDSYTERVIYMPDTYQPNDAARPQMIPGENRSQHGLPPSATVLCCFNQNKKITADLFGVWVRLMRKHQNCVLWLLASTSASEKNLVDRFKREGIDPARIIFAPRVDLKSHLSRQHLADIFLDTFHYNAHTGASDALWAGVPVVTKLGSQFAARVCASVLSAMEVPELITHSIAQYEALISDLIEDPDRLDSFKVKIAQKRDESKLFDIKRYTTNFELALSRTVELFAQNRKPEDIVVADLNG